MGAIAALGLLAGLMIGCVGIGGVIVVPALVYFGGIPVQTAIPAAMMAYILSGITGTVVFAREKSIRWGMAGWLCAGATPAGFAGAWVSSVAATPVLELVIGLMCLGSGLNTLRGAPSPTLEERTLANSTLVMIGAFTGFTSALSGTGGPLVLVPILMALRLPVLTAVGLSQAIQLPIALIATVCNAMYGTLDWRLGALLAVALTFGSWQGARLAHSVPRKLLRWIISVVLTVLGVVILAKIGRRLVP